MNKLNQTSKWEIVGVVVVVAVVLIVLYGGGQNASPMPAGTSSPTGATVSDNGSAVPGGTTPAPSGGTSAGGTKAPTPSGPKTVPMTFVTPVPGDTWKIGTQNPIQWSREGNFSGQIELLDASTLQLVGVILNQIGTHQTSYTWNTRDLLLSRTNPLKKSVVAGRYVIKISFDGNNLSPITSQPINVVQ
jgi:hypothetical protein